MPKASGIEVHCAHDALVLTDSLKAHPKNPNRHPEKQVQLLARIIHEQGWRAPITVSNRSGFIVRGHCRLDAAVMLKLRKVPVDYQDYADDAAEMADLLADNNIATYAEIDDTLMREVLGDLQSAGIDMELSGFTALDVDKLLTLPEPKSPGPPDMELQPNEHHDYIVFMFDDSATWMKIVELLGLGKVKASPHSETKIGLGRVLNGDRLVKMLAAHPVKK